MVLGYCGKIQCFKICVGCYGPYLWSFEVMEGSSVCEGCFRSYINYTVGSGEKILFWLDTWLGDRPLAAWYPNLFSCDRDWKVKVSSYMVKNGDIVHWGPFFRMSLQESQENHLFHLLNIIRRVFSPRVYAGCGFPPRMVCYLVAAFSTLLDSPHVVSSLHSL